MQSHIGIGAKTNSHSTAYKHVCAQAEREGGRKVSSGREERGTERERERERDTHTHTHTHTHIYIYIDRQSENSCYENLLNTLVCGNCCHAQIRDQ